MSSKLEYIRSLRQSVDSKIAVESSNRKKYEKFKQGYDNLIVNLQILKTELSNYQRIERETKIKLKDFRKVRKKFLEEFVSNAVNYVLDQNYTADLMLVPRGKDLLGSILLDYTAKSGKVVTIDPSLQNGGLLQQITAVSFGIAVNILTGNHLLILDEAFNGGDSDSLLKVQKLIQIFLDYDESNVVIMNEHNINAYKDLYAKLIVIDKNIPDFSGRVIILEDKFINADKEVNINDKDPTIK